MSSVVIILLFGIGVSSANLLNHCDPERCSDLSPLEELEDVKFLPSEEDLKRICPSFLKYIDCEMDNVKECNGVGIEELALSPNRTIAGLSSLLLNIGSLAADICDENTVLHQDYVTSVDCFKEHKENLFGDECSTESRKLALGFYEFVKLSENVENAELATCMETPLEIACIAHLFQKNCGLKARRTFLTIAERIEKADPECEYENFGNLKRAFLEYVNLSDDQKEIYQLVLDMLIQRRR
ncbi:uncharacterized protein NPIL_492471 [Nephila pilipes]|uniref:Uncharacterized protein n=1 Tax=Nephila pilipes TaxID=299642 RepID=A0A8X6MKM2_NEPPI|nr:uncharacterized protein NPIL_492471 [Nephila pilipes]